MSNYLLRKCCRLVLMCDYSSTLCFSVVLTAKSVKGYFSCSLSFGGRKRRPKRSASTTTSTTCRIRQQQHFTCALFALLSVHHLLCATSYHCSLCRPGGCPRKSIIIVILVCHYFDSNCPRLSLSPLRACFQKRLCQL